MEMDPHPLGSLVIVNLRRDQLWAVAQAYDADPDLTERNFCEDLAAGKFNTAITFPADRVDTPWNADGISFNGGGR
jgi:hypothetical protein